MGITTHPCVSLEKFFMIQGRATLLLTDTGTCHLFHSQKIPLCLCVVLDALLTLASFTGYLDLPVCQVFFTFS